MTSDPEQHPYRWAVDGPPLGIWETERGTASILASDTLTLMKDGTGTWMSRSALDGEEVIPVTWYHQGPGRLGLDTHRVTHVPPLPGEPEEEPGEEPGEEPDETPDDDGVERPIPITYEAAWIATETSSAVPVLKTIGIDDFWLLSGPLRYVGPT